MQKNVAGQKWTVFAFNRTTNVPLTGDAANITANLRIDGGAADAVDDTNPAELEDGYYEFDITQAESNGNKILIAPASSTSGIQVIGVPGVVFTTPPNFPAMGIESDGDLTQVNNSVANSDMRGTDSAALASVATEARLAELDAANLPADVAAIPTTAMRGTDGANTVVPDAAGVAPTATEIRQEMDANSTVFASLLEGLFMQVTTIATLSSQTSFTLTAGSADNDAYNGATIIVVDASTGTQKAFGSISDYTGSTRTVTLAQDPGIFTMAATDKVYILPSDVFAILDKLLSGTTHNLNNTAGKILRQIAGFTLAEGTAQAGGVGQITLAAGESAVDDIYRHQRIIITDGTGAGQVKIILDYAGSTKVARVSPNWNVTPDATSTYEIVPGITHAAGGWNTLHECYAQAGGASTITLSASASAIDDFYNNQVVVIHSGTGYGQVRVIIDYDGTTKIATVHRAWATNPSTDSQYIVEAGPFGPYITDLVLDEVNTGATHNVTNSIAKQIRESSAVLVTDSGTAQAGAAGTITLAAGANANDDFYNDMRIVIVGGTGAGQARVIHDYNGTTKVATTAPNWVINPDATSEYQIQAQSNVHVHELEANAVAQILADSTPFDGASIALIKAVTDRQAKIITAVTAQTGTLSTTEMTTDLTITDTDQLNGKILTFNDDTTTVALRGQQTDITASVAAGGKLTFTALTTAPVNGDTAQIT